MATSTLMRTICSICGKIQATYICQGCSQQFCFVHLSQHRTNIEQEFEQLKTNHDQIRQQINDLKIDPTKHRLLEQINQWEKDSINKIQQQAQLCRTQWIQCSNKFVHQIEEKLNHLAQQIQNIHQENNFNEFDLNDLKQRLEKLEKQLNQPKNLSIVQRSTLISDKISLVSSSGENSWRLS